MKTPPLISWSNQLETGLDDVDSQHKRLVDIINELGRMQAEGATTKELHPVLARLRDYTVYHFQHEADLMQSLPVNQSNKAAHLKAHKGFVNRIEKVSELIEYYPDAVVSNLLAFLVKWLVHHIIGMDARMAREIIALRSGKASRPIGSPESQLHEGLVDTISELYDSLGARTFEIVELNRKLQVYYDRQEEENALAQSIIQRLIQRKEMAAPHLHYWLAPAAVFSGDIIAAVQGPGKLRYAILADATGHGLAAAITVLPVLSVFYALAERGCTIGEILAEINLNLRSTLSGDRFVALTMLCFDEANSTAEIWVGGMPNVLLLGKDGHLIQLLESSQLPLGIVDSTPEMTVTTSIICEPGSQFVMYSDGLIEAANAAGEQFGAAWLERALQSATAERRVAAVKDALAVHIGTAAPHDDIALLLFDC